MRAARAVVVTATVVFLLVVCRWRPWDLFDRAAFSGDFYDEQARAFLHGRLDVDPAVPGPEGFVIGERTYLYYGPFLALVRMPFAIFGDVFTGRLVRISMVLGFASLLTAAYHLGELARRWARSTSTQREHSARGDAWWRTPLLVAAVACSPALFLTGWVSVYHETELWACALAMWAMVAALRCAAEPTRRDALLAGASAAAATLVRAPVGFGAAFGVGVVALLVWRRDRAPLVPVTLVGSTSIGVVAHFAVNVAKFGSLLGLPGDKQLLSLQNPERAAWFAGNGGSFFGTRFLPTTVAHYFRPDTIRFERLVPFVRFGPPAEEYGSYPLESATPAASLTASATLLLLAALVGTVVLVRRRAWAWLAMLVGGCIAAVPSFLIGFVGNRYLVDMLPALIVPAAIACWTARMPSATTARRVAQAALVALVAWGGWCNVALATWVQNLKEPGFTSWRYEVDDVLFGDPAPGIIGLDRTAPVPRDGIVAIDDSSTDAGACGALYIAEQGAWVALERPDGWGRQLTGRLAADALASADPVLVVGGEDWSVTARRAAPEAADERWTISLTRGDVEVATGSAALTAATALRIVRDDVTRELSVSVDGEVVAFSFDVGTGAPVPAAGFTVDPPIDPAETLCRQLQARR